VVMGGWCRQTPAAAPPSTCEKGPPSPSLSFRSSRVPRFAVGPPHRGAESHRSRGGTPEMRKMRGVTLQKAPRKNVEISTYETSPPRETTSDLADFHQRQGHAPRVARKGREIAPELRRETIARSFSPTAADKLAGGSKSGSYPPAGGSDDPPFSKTRPPSGPPWFFSSYRCRSRHRTVHFSPWLLRSRYP
jgi:hypothetical protein